jgi:Mce-associated membrane protein
VSPNLYDLLDVDQSAGADEIRAAWKAAIADLDPTDRRFRVYNDAAGVLLDPDKRAAYDAELASQQAEAEAEEEPATPVRTEQPAAVPAAGPPAPAGAVVAGTPATTSRPGPPGWALGAAGLGAVLALALAVTLLLQPGGQLFSGDDSPKEIAERNVRKERASVEAETAAERMVGPVLSYDHRTMDEDLERIRAQMTEEMGEKQAKAWPSLTEEAKAQRVVVEATPVASAVTRVAPDGRRATVVVFLDQKAEKRGTAPFVLRMWATMSLVKDDGRWLLDDLCTDSDCQ